MTIERFDKDRVSCVNGRIGIYTQTDCAFIFPSMDDGVQIDSSTEIYPEDIDDIITLLTEYKNERTADGVVAGIILNS